MPRSWRQTLGVTMLTLYGLVSLCGSGLHALIDSGVSHASADPGDQATGPILKAIASHCPICDFQAQGQLAVEFTRVISRPYTSPHVSVVLALVASRDRHPSCSPRAPPIFLPAVA
jgi:hypothetical protein